MMVEEKYDLCLYYRIILCAIISYIYAYIFRLRIIVEIIGQIVSHFFPSTKRFNKKRQLPHTILYACVYIQITVPGTYILIPYPIKGPSTTLTTTVVVLSQQHAQQLPFPYYARTPRTYNILCIYYKKYMFCLTRYTPSRCC